jgi:hypothetical protein
LHVGAVAPEEHAKRLVRRVAVSRFSPPLLSELPLQFSLDPSLAVFVGSHEDVQIEISLCRVRMVFGWLAPFDQTPSLFHEE